MWVACQCHAYRRVLPARVAAVESGEPLCCLDVRTAAVTLPALTGSH